ncbi:MAG: ThiF family adenylyltransferase [Gammaproteobacteria bacterium]|nr:ThiF family adenylyltransferase [Gammaproteobacteria bacterium]
MNAPRALVFAGVQHDQLRAHLFPGDGLESAAVLICSRSAPSRVRLLVRDVLPVPHNACRVRQPNAITWPGSFIEQALDIAESDDLTLVLLHSHPGGLFEFSEQDDRSDREVMPSLLASHGEFHCSAIMTPDGAVKARWYDRDINSQDIELVTVSGHDIRYWWAQNAAPDLLKRRPIAFTSAMRTEMGRLTANVIGVSGTGSVVAEQLNRLGIGRVKHTDFDIMELKNVNRILNSTIKDAEAHRLKVEMFVEAVAHYRGVGVAEAIPLSIFTREAIVAAGQCDVLFCCVDSLEARQIVDLIAAAFLLPLFDVGVVIPTRNNGEMPVIGDVCGRIDYVQPGGSSLGDRGVYTPDSLRAEYLRRNAPDAHQQEMEAGYIKGVIDEAPGVISLNMRAASACVNEFIARAYPFRHESNELYARTQFSLAACEEDYFPETFFPHKACAHVLGRGSKEPLLGLPFLSLPREKEIR